MSWNHDTDNSNNGRDQMSSQDTTDEALGNEAAENADRNGGDDSLASKLSKELSNWRRRRTTGRSKHEDGPSVNYQSDSARTIKVRGHETLVIRKPKLSPKPQARSEDKGDQQ
jgi:hypothetical protein